MTKPEFNKLLDSIVSKAEDEPLTNDELEALFTFEFGNAFEEEPFAPFLVRRLSHE